MCPARTRMRARPQLMSPYACDYGAGGAALFDIVNVQNWTRRRISGPFKHARFRIGSGAAILLSICNTDLAHQAEHSPCKREAGGSSPPASTIMHSWRNGRRSRLRSGRPRGMEVQVLPGAPFLFARSHAGGMLPA